MALRACTTGEGDEINIREGFGGLFVYLFVMGVLFDAWLNRTMTVANRVLAVLRAQFFLHFWRAHIVHMSNKYPDLWMKFERCGIVADFDVKIDEQRRA
ncbi:hypothetical protein B0H13DRAFT_2342135 [Mycena leptocephala]|nr:hypothetical protein B0H13DRAFT_2342135 [Mycena leptocephala]